MVRRRTVGPNARSYTGRYIGADGGTVRFESKLERDFLILLRFRRDVVEITEQPFTLTFQDSRGRQRSYTPDFLVRFEHKTSLYEIKFRDELRRNWARYQEPYQYARSWAKVNGYRFRIMTDRVIRGIRLENFRLLEAHLDHPPDPGEAAVILAELRNGAWTTGELAKALHPEPRDRGLFWQTFWRLLANSQIQGDFDQPIGMEFVIWIGG